MPTNLPCNCCDVDPNEIVVTINFPCETVDVLSHTTAGSATGCFWTDGSGNEFTTARQVYDCSGTEEIVTRERGGIVGPNATFTPPGCPAEVVTGNDVTLCTYESVSYLGSVDSANVFPTAEPTAPNTGGLSVGSSILAVSYEITKDGFDNLLTSAREAVMIAVDVSSLVYYQDITYTVRYDYTYDDASTSTTTFPTVAVPISPGGTEEVIGTFDHPPFLAGTTEATTTITIGQCSG